MTTDVHDYAAMLEAQQKVREGLKDYDGDFGFLLEMRDLAQDEEYTFSERQLAAIMKSLIRHNNAKAGVSEKVTPLIGDNVPEGTTRHAVINANGSLTFLRVDRIVKPDNRWNGWVFVKQILGPDESFRVGAQRPNGEYQGQWPHLVKQVGDDPKATLSRYGLEIGKCGVCGLRLTDETSRRIGVGPICRGNIGL